MQKRIQTTIWEARKGEDYLLVGKDQIAYKQNFQIKEDTLLFKNGKKFLIRYSAFDNFWFSTIDGQEIAWYIDYR